ncbi:MAG: hypothetical protein V1779_16315 [bacterium]
MTKFLFLVSIVLSSTKILYSQSYAVGINTSTPDASAILELYSTEKGFLVPRMTNIERDAIASPATGLLIYQLDGLDGFYYWDGTQWLWIGTSLTGNYVYGSGAPGQVGYWTSSSTVTGDDNLFWNSTTNRLGIGTNTPRETLEITGGLRVQNTTNTNLGAIRWTGDDFEGYTTTGWKSFTKKNLAGDGEAGQVTYWESSTFLAGDDRLFWDVTNNWLGIGTTTPREQLEVVGGIRVGFTNATNPGGFRWNSGTSDFEGWNGTQWLSFTSSTLTGSGTPTQVTFWNSPSNLTGDNDLYYDESNTFLGLGTMTPREALDIAGGVKVGNTTAESATVTGTIRWNGSDFEGYDGGSWLSFTKVSSMIGTGTNGQIAYWHAPAPAAEVRGSDDNFFDLTNKRHGVKTNSPAYPLEVDGTIMVGGDGKSGQFIFYSEQGPTDYQVFVKPSSTMTQNTIYTFPANYGNPNDALITDGAGNLYWDEPLVALGDFWQLKPAPRQDVLETYQDWGLARYSAVITGATPAMIISQVNFGVNSNSRGTSAMIAGGLNNSINAFYGFISGGEANQSNGNYAYIFGGSQNFASGNYNRLSGFNNDVSGVYTIIENGQNLDMAGNRSYAFRGGLSTAPYSLPSIVDETFNILDANFHFNDGNADADFRIDGDNNDNVMYVDASADKIGLNTDTPGHLLEVKGNVALTNNSSTATALRFQEPVSSGTNYSSFSATSQTVSLIYKLPPDHKVPHSALFNYGNGILEWATPDQVKGYLRATVVTVPGSYTPSLYNVHILVRNLAPATITLPPAATAPGKRYFIKKMSPGGVGFYVTIDPAGAERIDGAADFKMKFLNGGTMCVSNGTAWFIYSSYGN